MSRKTNRILERIGVPLKTHVDAVFTEKDRALEMAGEEREKSAAALRGQQDRAEDRATDERDKSATALATSLERSIKEGDERLREHISNQVQQINRDLDSAEKLEQERLARAMDGLRSLELQTGIARAYSEKAIDKADRAIELRFSGFNEFNDRIDMLTRTFATRELLENAIKSLGEKVEGNTLRIERAEGRGSGFAASGAIVISIISVVATIAIGILVIVTRH